MKKCIELIGLIGEKMENEAIKQHRSGYFADAVEKMILSQKLYDIQDFLEKLYEDYEWII